MRECEKLQEKHKSVLSRSDVGEQEGEIFIIIAFVGRFENLSCHLNKITKIAINAKQAKSRRSALQIEDVKVNAF